MTLLRINAHETGLCLHESGDMDTEIASLARGQGPVIVMTHGYRYQPRHRLHCPHAFLTSDTATPARGMANWAHQLDVGTQASGVSFGWQARGTIWQAWARAGQAGAALAALIRRIRAVAPHRPIHAVVHSLGARVVLAALPALEAGDLSRVVLLAGAEYSANARAALASPAGRRVEILNVTSRENDLFDFLLESCVAPPAPRDSTIGQSMPHRARVLSLQLDDPDCLLGLAQLGYDIAPPSRLVCHWSVYARPGVFNLYRDFLLTPELTPIPRLRAALPQQRHPRWSRLFGRAANGGLPPLSSPPA